MAITFLIEDVLDLLSNDNHADILSDDGHSVSPEILDSTPPHCTKDRRPRKTSLHSQVMVVSTISQLEWGRE